MSNIIQVVAAEGEAFHLEQIRYLESFITEAKQRMTVHLKQATQLSEIPQQVQSLLGVALSEAITKIEAESAKKLEAVWASAKQDKESSLMLASQTAVKERIAAVTRAVAETKASFALEKQTAIDEAIKAYIAKNPNAPTPPPVTSDLVAIDLRTKKAMPLAEGYEVGQNFLQLFDVEAFPGEVFGSGSTVEFWLDGSRVRVEGSAPYTMSGATYRAPYSTTLTKGAHTLRVVALARDKVSVLKLGRAQRTISLTVK